MLIPTYSQTRFGRPATISAAGMMVFGLFTRTKRHAWPARKISLKPWTVMVYTKASFADSPGKTRDSVGQETITLFIVFLFILIASSPSLVSLFIPYAWQKKSSPIACPEECEESENWLFIIGTFVRAVLKT